MAHDECPMAVATREQRPLRHAEAVAIRPDGTRVPFLAYPTPLYDAEGDVVAMVNMLVDITPRKQAEERQRLLVRELNHRVKNTLATVQSIAAQSFRNGAASDAFRWFEGRLMALSTAHDVLTRENWTGGSLREVVTQAVAPHDGATDPRFAIDGEDLLLPPKMALSLAMALHELCTNAAKYGALAGPRGRVAIDWRVQGSGAGRRLRLRWAEQDGPPVAPPSRKGFGSRLLERGLARELDAEVTLSFPSTGAVCEIDAPILEAATSPMSL
jgi:two-component sensor histidine kinase